ncbi:MAG TPA: hypothetical protein VF911_00335 [Thermoanaerobaculia bacterium]|jgi:hypothetical protein
MRRKLLALSLVLLGACASSGNSTNANDNSSNNSTATTSNAKTVQPTVEIIQKSGVPPAARHVQGGINIQYAVRVGNPSTDAITLRRVSVQSVSEGAYTVRHSQPFDVVVPASEREVVEFWAPAQAGNTVTGANGPVTVRVVCEFTGPKGTFQEIVTRVVNPSATVFE